LISIPWAGTKEATTTTMKGILILIFLLPMAAIEGFYIFPHNVKEMYKDV
jgi:hypothetical protein